MSKETVFERFFLKARVPREDVYNIMAGCRDYLISDKDLDKIGLRLWRLVGDKCKEAVLNALAQDACERLREHLRLTVAHCDPIQYDPDQLTLDLAAALPWPWVDKSTASDLR